MDKLYAIEAFVKIVDAGSITAAAEALTVSQPSMVRLLAALERELGVRLLNRTTRRMSLTDEGRDYYQRSRQILAAVDDAALSLHARRATPQGRLRIASSVSFGRMFVAPVVAEFLLAHPEVNVELLLLDRVVDLVEEGMDLAVRVAKLADSTLVAHAIGEVHRVVVASPALLKRSKMPTAPADLSQHRCVSFTGVVSPAHWRFADGRKQLQVPVRNALVSNQIDAAVAACVQGVGFGCFLSYQVQEQVNLGNLTRVLRRFEGEPIPASIVYPSARHTSPNVRSFVSLALPLLRSRLTLLQQPPNLRRTKK